MELPNVTTPTPTPTTPPMSASDSTDKSVLSTASFVRGFFTRDVFRVILVQFSTAILLGYVIGYVGVYNTLIGINEDCTLLTTPLACESVVHTQCAWGLDALGNETCIFRDKDCSVLTEDSCRAASDKCAYDNDDNVCKHLTGFNSLYSGIFSGAMTVGGMIGSMLGGAIVNRAGRKRSLSISAIINTVAAILVHVSRAADEYWLLVSARLVLGIGVGLGCIAAPMYTEEMAPESYRGPVGTMFQVFCTLGIAVAATMGMIVEPHDFSSEQNNEVRIQMFNMVQTMLCVLAFIVSCFVPESTTWLKIQEDRAAIGHRTPSESSRSAAVVIDKDSQNPLSVGAQGIDGEKPCNDDDTVLLARKYSLVSMAGPLFIAFILCLAQQMTGINAIMNYAPSITKSMGLSSMLGNFVVMLWNFITTLFSIPASKVFTLRQMFITGVIVATCATLLTGVPIYPGVYDNETGRHGLAGLGIFVFILAFEVGIGPAFYVLSQQLFPKSFRPKGSAFTMAVQYAFNIIINVCFPIAVTNLSGGPSGDQDKGLAIVFFFFTGCGAISAVLLYRFLYPFNEDDEPTTTVSEIAV